MMIRVTSKVVAVRSPLRRPSAAHRTGRGPSYCAPDRKKVFVMIRNLFSDDGAATLLLKLGERGGMKGGDGSGCSLANNAALCGNREDSDKGKKRREGRMSVSVAGLCSLPLCLVSGLKK